MSSYSAITIGDRWEPQNGVKSRVDKWLSVERFVTDLSVQQPYSLAQPKRPVYSATYLQVLLKFDGQTLRHLGTIFWLSAQF